MYTGIDLVDVVRIQNAVEKTPGFLHKIFTEGEIAYSKSKKNPYPSLAVRFAAKEAVRKLNRKFQQGIPFTDIEVRNDEEGRPYIVLHDVAEAVMKDLKLTALDVSLSHTDTQAVAVVLAY